MSLMQITSSSYKNDYQLDLLIYKIKVRVMCCDDNKVSNDRLLPRKYCRQVLRI